jgi:hypothetical protein
MNPSPQQNEAEVDVNPERVRAVVVDPRPDVVEAFAPLARAEQNALATEAWRIGVRALKNAYAQASEARLADIGKTLKDDLGAAMGAALEQHQERMTSELKRFLDPTDGEFSRRLEQFIAGDGELARRLAQFVAPTGSVLAETLAKQVGEQSVLFKKLSPTDSEGLIYALKDQMASVMADSKASVATAMDPLTPDSPVARFLAALRAELKKAENDRSAQIATALKALDANDPNSLLSNLARKTQETSRSLLTAMNPADPKSPLGLLQNRLTELLETHVKSSAEMLHASAKRQEFFEKEIREAVTRIEVQRATRRVTAQGGNDFEDVAAAVVQDYLKNAPVVCARISNVVGIRDRCKVGDLCVRFTDESLWAGTSIVFEFKHDASYHVDKALHELDVARANREASVGVFVMAQSHASSDFPAFARHGHNILVTFDLENPETTPRLEAAILLAVALASRKHAVQDTSSLDAVKDIENVLTEQLTRIEKMRSASEAIRKNNEAIRKELQKAEEDLKELSEHARESIALLSAGEDEDAERAEPIAFRRNGTSEAPAA